MSNDARIATTAEILAEVWRLFYAGHRQQAAALAQAVLEREPGHDGARVLIAAICLAEGRLAEAAQRYREVLARQPNDASSHNGLGVALARQGKLDEAHPHFCEVLRLTPDSAEAQNNLGLILKDQGQPAEAEQRFQHALRLQPGFAAAYSNLGLALRDQGRLEEALASLERSIELDPQSAEAHRNAGIVLRALRRLREAEARLRQATRLRPGYAEAHHQLAQVLHEQGKHTEANASLAEVNALIARQVDELLRTARTFQEARRYPEAEASVRQALRLQPNLAATHTALASVLQESGKPDEAEHEFRAALRLDPSAYTHDNLGTALARQGQNAAAREQFLEAIALDSSLVNAMVNAGNTFACEGMLTEAEHYFTQALQVNPSCAEAHYSLAMLWLLQGDFQRGWPEYEWRWQARGVRRLRPNFHQPVWDGSDLNGRTLLLYAEGGLGDTVQFIRYARWNKQRGGRTVLDAQPALVELLRGCEGIDQIIPRGTPLPEFDVYAPLMSLPAIFKTHVETIPAKVPYIHVADERVARWRREIGPLPGLKVGIAWQGSPVHFHDRVRSYPLSCLEPLANIDGIRLVVLQKHAGREQIPEFAARFPILDLGDRLDETSNGYLDTPAAMLSLDLVITPDSSLAHVAGALGVPVWLALPHVPEWRWLLEREDSPWYPSMRLFRQTSSGDWPGVFQRMATELRERTAR